MIKYAFLGAGALALSACVGGIPTPSSTGLASPAQPTDITQLSDSELCTYSTELVDAANAWEDYVNLWLVTFGRDPVNVMDYATAVSEVDNLLEARNIVCVTE